MLAASALKALVITSLVISAALGLFYGSITVLRGDPGSVELARYIIRATGAAGPVEFQQRLTIDQALEKARDLRDAHFSHITICNLLNGVEITDLEALMGEAEAFDRPKG